MQNQRRQRFIKNLGIRITKQIRFSIVSCLIILGIFSTFWFCFYLGERFFFDQLFYKKSVFHGYLNRYNSGIEIANLNWFDKQIQTWRDKDMIDLLSDKLQPSNQKDVKTIAIIGDSFTYGLGVLQNERFSSLLGPNLSKFGIKTKIYNFSEADNSILDYYAIYKLVKQQVKPDIIIFGLATNDLLIGKPKYYGTGLIITELDSMCPQPMFAFQYSDVAGPSNNKILTDSFSPKWRNRCYLNQIAKIIGADPTVLFFSFRPGETSSACETKDSLPVTATVSDYLSVLTNYGGRIIQNPINSQAADRVSIIESHPSRSAHKKYADYITNYLIKELANFSTKSSPN